MLYYSGFTRRIGDVDDGSTVMDYLPAERQRGITITSAAITFQWKSPDHPMHTVNLIDTPGHADFTFEVERSIRVLDGAVTILDGVAGVEAQTEKVWRQAAKHQIPRIVFVNKLDRVGARFGSTVREVAQKLNGWPAVLQLPLYESDGKGGEDVLHGVVDIVERRVFLYEPGSDGTKIKTHDYKWLAKHHPQLHDESVDARSALVELLSSHDDALVEEYLELGEHHLIPSKSIKRALRAATLTGTGEVIPVLCGASFRNVGVQPLLDAVIDYLPSPLDRPPLAVTHGVRGQHRALLTAEDAARVCALAFKVVNDPKRGAMVYVRVYSGTLNQAATLWNTGLQVKERAHRLLQMYANEAVDITSIPSGHIGVIIGLKATRTGDTLIDDSPAARAQEKVLTRKPTPPQAKGKNAYLKAKEAAAKSKTPTPPAAPVVPIDYKTLQLKPIDIPPPVFFASLEPYSISAQKQMDQALEMLLREDPSLHVAVDPDSGQTLLSGMGELHLEIARDRLVGDLKAKADMGRILIAFRESITEPSPPITHTAYMPDGTSATVTASVSPLDSRNRRGATTGEKFVKLDTSILALSLPTASTTSTAPSTATLASATTDTALHRAAVISGATAALSRGPHHNLPLHAISLSAKLTFPPSSTTSSAAISSAARTAITQALRSVPPVIIEPMMRVVITCDEAHLGKVVNDISGNRGGTVLALDATEADTESLSLRDRVKEKQRQRSKDLDVEAAAQHQQHQEPVSVKREPIDINEVFVPSIGDIDNAGRRSGDETGSGSGEHGKRDVLARVPLMECVGYLKHLRSLTAGRGTFVMELEGWEKVGGARVHDVIKYM